MKKITKILFLFIATFIFLTGCNNTEEKENKKETQKENINKEVIKDQNLEVFKFTNTSLKYENSTSVLQTTVTNTSSEKQYLKEFKIHVRDKKDNEIVELIGYVGDYIDKNQSKIITSSYGDDLTNAYSIDYEIIR